MIIMSTLTSTTTEIEIVTEAEIVTTEQNAPTTDFATERKRRKSLGNSIATKAKKAKTKDKDYTEYVYVGQEGVDKTTLAPLLKEDTDYNAKVHEVLEVGKEYTYPQICELLGEKTKSGNGKQSQLSTWYQHMEWEHPINPKTKKPSKKMLITTIHDTPRQRINQTYELTNFTKQELECNFIFSILDNENLHEEVSDFGLITGVKARDMHYGIGLVNDNYYLVRSNKKAIAEFLPVDNQIKIFSTIEKYNRQFTTSALSRLTRSRTIEGYMYTYIWTDIHGKEHLATDEEHLAIENGIKEMIVYAKEKSGIILNSIADLYSGKLQDNQMEDLQNHMIKLIREEVPTIKYFSRGYKLIYLKSKMRDYLDKLANEMGITLQELQQIKFHDSRQEHSDFQIDKAMGRNSHQPKTQQSEVSLINAIINNTNLNPMTDKEIKLEHDRKMIVDTATISSYIDSLTAGDINKILEFANQDTMEKHEQEYLESLLEDAISYCCMPLTLSKKNELDKEIEFADLNNSIDKFGNIKSFYLECKFSIKNKLYVTLHINHTKGHGRADKIDLILHDAYDLEKLQAYLIVSYNVETKVGQKYQSKKNK